MVKIAGAVSEGLTRTNECNGLLFVRLYQILFAFSTLFRISPA